MSQYPILQTKLYIPPIRPELVSRPRLIERLNAGLRQAKVSTQTDPHLRPCRLWQDHAGQRMGGQFTIGCRERRPERCAVAWLSLDESDNDLTRFLVYLIAALQTIEASVGKGVLSALQTPQPPPTEAILTSLINEITAIPRAG